MQPSDSTGDWDTIVRQIRWCAAVQTPVNCHCQLEDHPVGDVEPVKFFVQFSAQPTTKTERLGITVTVLMMLISEPAKRKYRTNRFSDCALKLASVSAELTYYLLAFLLLKSRLHGRYKYMKGSTLLLHRLIVL